MWELIDYNKRQSYVLIGALAFVLMLLGGLIGTAMSPAHGGTPLGVGTFLGILVALCVWLVMTLLSWFGGDSFVLAISRATPVTHDQYPQLWNVVEEMAIAAGSPVPKIYVIDDTAPNAFATGRTPETAAVAVTKGLIEKLNRDELQGVIGHEMGHIRNRDILFMTLAGVIVGTIALLCDVFLRSIRYGGLGGGRGSSSRRCDGRGAGLAMFVILALTLILAILAPIFARLLYLAISRKREYLADASSVELTRYPEGLAAALEKISSDREVLEVANRATAHLYIVNPIKPTEERYSSLSSTHPPIKERIAILRSIAGGASLADYERARMALGVGDRRGLVSARALRESKKAPLRGPSEYKLPGGERPGHQKMTPQVLAEKLAPLAPVILPGTFACACGARVLIPAGPRSTIVQCLACGVIHDLRAMGAAAGQGTPPAAPASAGPPRPAPAHAPAGAEGRARTARFEEPSGAPPAPERPVEPPRENNPFGITFDGNGSPVFPPRIICPHCASEITVPRGFMGSRGPCPKCRMMIAFFER